jgi:hypothetical protein
MCTVSYVSTSKSYLLTSNRDEKTVRKQATFPLIENDVLFPKDLEKDGTWIALKENGNAICLLNGAFEKHTIAQSYRKSRGLIVLDIIKNDNIVNEVSLIDLLNIEPFTLIIIENEDLVEFRWDGESKHVTKLDSTKHYIWRSSTLYTNLIRQASQQLFTSWCNNEVEITKEKIIDFHTNTKINNVENSLVVNRNNELKTVSITNISKNEFANQMTYIDLTLNKTVTKQFEKVTQ